MATTSKTQYPTPFEFFSEFMTLDHSLNLIALAQLKKFQITHRKNTLTFCNANRDLYNYLKASSVPSGDFTFSPFREKGHEFDIQLNPGVLPAPRFMKTVEITHFFDRAINIVLAQKTLGAILKYRSDEYHSKIVDTVLEKVNDHTLKIDHYELDRIFSKPIIYHVSFETGIVDDFRSAVKRVQSHMSLITSIINSVNETIGAFPKGLTSNLVEYFFLERDLSTFIPINATCSDSVQFKKVSNTSMRVDYHITVNLPCETVTSIIYTSSNPDTLKSPNEKISLSISSTDIQRAKQRIDPYTPLVFSNSDIVGFDLDDLNPEWLTHLGYQVKASELDECTKTGIIHLERLPDVVSLKKVHLEEILLRLSEELRTRRNIQGHWNDLCSSDHERSHLTMNVSDINKVYQSISLCISQSVTL